MTVFLSIVIGAVGSILAAELLDVCPALTRRLIAASVRRLPAAVRERYHGEWLADFDYLRQERGKLHVLLWAVGVYFGSGRLIAELRKDAGRTSSRRHYVPMRFNPFTLDGVTSGNFDDIDIPTVIRELDDNTTSGSADDVIGCSG